MRNLVHSGISFFKEKGPLLLSIAGCGGVVVTAVLVGKATPTAIEQIEAEKAEKGADLTALETIKTVGMTYGPAIVSGIVTIGCILSANALNKNAQTSLAGAYVLLSKNFDDYKQAVKDIYGEQAHKEVLRHIADTEHDDTHPYGVAGFSSAEGVDALLPGTEEVLFYDTFSKRFFNATPARVLEAEYHLNRNYANRGDAMLDEFYEFLGIPCIEGGHKIGWEVSDEDECFYWIDFDHAAMACEDGSLDYIVIDYVKAPLPFESYLAR